MRPDWTTRILAGAALVIAAGAAGFWAHRLTARSIPRVSALTPTSPARRAALRQSLAANGPAATPPRAQTVPQMLPNVAFADGEGVTRRFSDWRGRPLLVNFWATWCSPCRAEIPVLERLSRAPVAGAQIIGVAVDSRPAVLRYARQAGIRYPLLIGTRPGLEVIDGLGMTAVFPFSVFVDARGRIVTLKIGRLHASEARFILGRVGALDQGHIDMATARRQIAAEIARLAVERARRPRQGA